MVFWLISTPKEESHQHQWNRLTEHTKPMATVGKFNLPTLKVSYFKLNHVVRFKLPAFLSQL